VSDDICIKLRDALTASIQRNLSNSVLLSGGLDSSIIASIASGFTDLTGVTVAYGDAPDLIFARLVADKYSIRNIVKELTDEDVRDAIENVIRIMKTFDPMEIRNTSVIYLSLEELRRNGFDSVMTGDGGDELFVGYSYMLRLEMDELESELQKLWQTMHFSSITVGKELKVTVMTPYLDSGFLRFAKGIPTGLKIKEEDGVKWGKWLLRTCFEDLVTKDVAWRKKMPLEQGAGISVFAERLKSHDSEVSSQKIKQYLMEDSVRIRDSEHLYYYSVYRRFFDPPREIKGDFRCPECTGCVSKDSRFCVTCGAFPINPTRDIR
jgi:asparagine synthase (glutamine-hydrolysing)